MHQNSFSTSEYPFNHLRFMGYSCRLSPFNKDITLVSSSSIRIDQFISNVMIHYDKKTIWTKASKQYSFYSYKYDKLD